MFRPCSDYFLFLFRPYSVFALSSFRLCFVFVPSSICRRSVFVSCLFRLCSVFRVDKELSHSDSATASFPNLSIAKFPWRFWKKLWIELRAPALNFPSCRAGSPPCRVGSLNFPLLHSCKAGSLEREGGREAWRGLCLNSREGRRCQGRWRGERGGRLNSTHMQPSWKLS